jgi:hypothetical protein
MENRRTLLFMGFVVGYLLFLSRYVDASAGGADSSGYLSFGRLLASGRIFAAERTIPGYSLPREHAYFYCPLGFKPAPTGKGLVSNYPPGLPLMFAITSKLVGWDRAAPLVLLVNSALAIALMVAFCRLVGLSLVGTACATGILAASPVTLAFSVQALSDIPAMTWVLLAVVLALQPKEHTVFKVLAGAAFGIAFLIRPTCLLILPTLITLYLLRGKRVALPPLPEESASPAWRLSMLTAPAVKIAWFSLGAAPVLFANCVFASRAYGNPFSTSYGELGYMFSSSYVIPSFLSFLRNIPVLFSPFALIAPACVFLRGLELRRKVALIGPVLLYLGFYASFSSTSETWWSLRYILPVAPMLVAGGILAFERLVSAPIWRLMASIFPKKEPHILANRFAWGAALAFLAAFTTCAVKLNRSSRFMNWGRADDEYRVAAEKLETLVAPNSVCLCMQTSGSLYYYTNLILVRSDQFDGERARSLFGWAREAGVPVYAALFDWEEDQVRSLPISGAWSLVTRSKPVGIWKWNP